MSSDFIANLKGLIGHKTEEYSVDDTEEIYNEEVEIYTDDDVDITDISIAEVPEKLILTCVLEKEKLQGNAKFKNLEIYKANYDACKSASLKFSQFGKLLLSNGATKDFFDKRIDNYRIEFADVLLKKEFKYQANPNISYEAKPKTVYLMNYGGSSSDKIDKLEQVFFHITNASNNPGVAISDEDFWRKKGIDPYTGGHIGDISVIPIREPRDENLAEMIRNGAIKAKIYDETTNEEFSFRSSGYIQKGEVVEICLNLEKINRNLPEYSI